MNEDQENAVFTSENDTVCITYEGGAYYFTISKQEVRGPFFEQTEVYQEALKDLVKLLGFTFDILAHIEDRARNIIRTVKGFDDADD